MLAKVYNLRVQLDAESKGWNVALVDPRSTESDVKVVMFHMTGPQCDEHKVTFQLQFDCCKSSALHSYTFIS